MKAFKRGMIFVTFFGCCFGMALLSAALGTKWWFEGRAFQKISTKNSTEFRPDASGLVHFGLFSGVKILNWGIGDRIFHFSVTETVGKLMSRSLWLATVTCLSGALFFSVVGAIFAVVNTASSPIEAIAGVPGLYAWNICAAILAFLSVIVWSIQYHLRLTNNVLTEDKESGWTTQGQEHFGYSFWLVVVAINLHIINCVLIYVATYQKPLKTRYEPPETKPGNSMLY